MQFLSPAFLIGLAAAGIPILLHFLQRKRWIEVPFAPLRFLQPTQQRQSRRLRLRRLLLLLLRVAAIICVVLAMARPTLTGGLGWLAPSGSGVSVLVLVDASASMRAQAGGSTLFDRAREELATIAQALSGRDELAVALADEHAHPLLEDFVRDPGLVLAEFGTREAGYGRNDYAAVFEDAFELLARANGTHREIHWIGDLQAADFDSTAREELAEWLEQDGRTHVFLRQVSSEPFVNREIVEVQRPATLLRAGETAEITTVVRQDGAEQLGLPLYLEVEGNALGETEIELPPDGSQLHVFPVTLPDAGDLSGSVRLRPDRYPPDDQCWFVLEVSDQVPVLVLRGLGQSEAERDPLLFLRAALDPRGENQGDFRLSVEDASRMDVTELLRARLVVGIDLRELGAARLSALTDYLNGGGTLLLFCGDPRVRAYANEKLLPPWTEARLGPFRGGTETYERFEIVDRDHPAFAGFRDEEIETLENVKLRNFFRMSEGLGRTLLRYRGGGAAVVEIEVGRGRLVLCGFHPSATAGDLPFSPMFLPFVQRLSGYLATAAWGRFGRQAEVGEALSVEAPVEGAADASLEIRHPDGRLGLVELDAQAAPPRLRSRAAERPGLYSFLVDGEVWAQLAVNVPRDESRREFLDADAFRDGLFGEETRAVRGLEGDELGDALARARQGRPIHRFFLILAGLFLVAESLLGRRVSLARERRD